MDYSATFARHFSRLVSLLIHDVGNTDEQKVALRALVAVNKESPVTIAVRGAQLLANEELVPGALTGVGDLTDRMTSFCVREIRIGASSSPADLLALSRMLASGPGGDSGDGGARVQARLGAFGSKTIHFVASVPSHVVPAPAHPPLPPLPPPPAAAPAPEPSPPSLSGRVAAEAPKPPERVPSTLRARRISGPAPFMQISTANEIMETPTALFARLRATTDVGETTRALDDLVSIAENSAREGKLTVVGDIFHTVVQREHDVRDPDLKRAYAVAIRRMSKPTLLRAVANLLPRQRDREDERVAVLARTGEDGADALIDQLTQAQTTDDRRVFFEVLKRLKAGVPSLVNMLGDARWFVARNAADLLGELRSFEAESALVGLLHHNDDRVRRSATNALMRLSTDGAVHAVYQAIRDPAPQVRIQAAAAVSTRADPQTAATLIRAVDEEHDAEVQLAMLAALGKVGTKDAVERLVRAAEPERGLFKKKTTAIRVGAVQALGDARTPAALAALKALSNDKDKEVRDAVDRVAREVGRG